MLVLSRKPQQEIRIGNDIVITVCKVIGNRVAIGISAPRGVNVIRGELEPLDTTGKEPTNE